MRGTGRQTGRVRQRAAAAERTGTRTGTDTQGTGRREDGAGLLKKFATYFAKEYGRIDELRQQYPVAAMCRVLDVSESGYHAWRKRPLSPRAQANARLEVEIRAAHERTRQTYGPKRLQADLADHGICVGIHKIKSICQRSP